MKSTTKFVTQQQSEASCPEQIFGVDMIALLLPLELGILSPILFGGVQRSVRHRDLGN